MKLDGGGGGGVGAGGRGDMIIVSFLKSELKKAKNPMRGLGWQGMICHYACVLDVYVVR